MIRFLLISAAAVALWSQPAQAEFFADKVIVLDVADEPAIAPVNDSKTQLPPLTMGQTVDLEVFIPTGGTGAMTSLSLVFDNTGLVFTQNFSIEGVSGLVSASSVNGHSVAGSANAVRLVPSTGYVATVTLRARRDVPSGTEVRLAEGTAIDDARQGGVDALDVTGARIRFTTGLPIGVAMDLDTSTGNQGRTSGRAAPGSTAIIEIYVDEIQRAVGFILRLEYDSRQVAYEAFEPGSLFPNIQVLAPDTSAAAVEISGASLGAEATASSGLLGRVQIALSDSLQGSATVRLAYAEFLLGSEFVRSGSVQVRLASDLVDFDRNGATNFRDFLLFAQNFGQTSSDATYDETYDLDRDGAVSFSDFVIVAEAIQEALGT